MRTPELSYRLETVVARNQRIQMASERETQSGSAVSSSELVRQSLHDWIDSGRGDECFWEGWPECPTEIDLTPNMVLAALNSLPNAPHE